MHVISYKRVWQYCALPPNSSTLHYLLSTETTKEKMTLNRNFRTTYYKTLGVPVMQRIAMYAALFGEPAVSCSKVMKLAQEIGVPTQYRGLVWQLLTGVLPPYPSVWEFTLEQRQEMYQDIVDAVPVLQPVAVANGRREESFSVVYPVDSRPVSPSASLCTEGEHSVEREDEAETDTKQSSSTTERRRIILLHRTYWSEILARQDTPSGMQDELFLDAVARMVCDVFAGEMERFWCFAKLLDIFHDGLSLLEPLQAYCEMSVPECEMLFLRTLETLRKTKESYITHPTQ